MWGVYVCECVDGPALLKTMTPITGPKHCCHSIVSLSAQNKRTVLDLRFVGPTFQSRFGFTVSLRCLLNDKQVSVGFACACA